jgi:hypothetical protein
MNKQPFVSPHDSGASDEMAMSLAIASHVQAIDADRLAALIGHSAGRQIDRHWVDALQPFPSAVEASAPEAMNVADAADATKGSTTSSSTPPSLVPAALAVSLSSLLDRRCSDLLPGPSSRDLVTAVLHHLGSVRAIDVDAAGRIWQSRAHPSAGGTHSIEPLVHACNVDGLRPGWYRQEGNQLGRIEHVAVLEDARLTDALNDALRHSHQPTAVLYAIAEPDRLRQRYPEGSSLLWRDAGAFLMTAHLIATAHGFSSTIIGLTTPLANSSIDDTASGAAIPAYAVGAVAMGGPIQSTAKSFDNDDRARPRSPEPSRTAEDHT